MPKQMQTVFAVAAVVAAFFHPQVALSECEVVKVLPATVAPPMPLVTQTALPSTRQLYGRPSYAVATPFPSASDNYYSGANTRPHLLTNWYGNGYNW